MPKFVCHLYLCHQIYKNRVANINPLLFDIVIPNLVCGHIFGSWNAVHLKLSDHCDLDFWYQFRKTGCPVLTNNVP